MKRLLTFILSLCSLLALAQKRAGSGNSLDFNGTSEYVSIPNAPALNPTTAFTVEAWIKADAYGVSSWNNTIVGKDTWSSISEGWVLRCGANGTLSFNLALNSTNAWYEVTSSPTMQINKWYHVAGTYDGSTLSIYINGIPSGTFSQTGTITATSAPLYIGNFPGPAAGRYFNGEIDEVRLWNQCLTQTELRQYMCRKVDASHPQLTKLIAYYNMDAGSGSSLMDQSGNGHTGTSLSTTWPNSGAAIGNFSTSLYTTSWTGKSVKIGHVNGDSLMVSNISGNPNGIQIYRIDSTPNVTTPPAGVAQFYNQRYWGVFPTSGTTVTTTLTYNYNGYPGITNQGALNLSNRATNATATWTGVPTVLDSVQKTLVKTSAAVGEYVLGKNDNLTDFTLNAPTSGSVVTLSGLATQTVSFDWRRSKLTGPGTVTYLLKMDFDTADFSTPLKTKTAASSGTDSTVSLTYQELAAMMTANGVYYDQTMDAKWTVDASGGPVKKTALLPFDIELKRDIISSDQIYGFYILNPNEDTLIVYNGGNTIIDFNWLPATSTAGPNMTYEVQFAGFSGDFNSPLGTFPANNSGLDSVASISHGDLALMLANIPIGNNQIFQFKWRTLATLGSLTRPSLDSHFVWIMRMDDPFIGVNSLNEEEGNRVFPNPVSKTLKFEIPSFVGQIGTLYLGDISGKLIKKQPITIRETNQLDVSDVVPGVYLLEILIGRTMVEMKVMIE